MAPLRRGTGPPQNVALQLCARLKELSMWKARMAGGQIYSAPYVLDILALWVNEEWMREAGLTGIETEEDFYRFLAHDWGEGAMPTAVPGRKPMYIMNWES